MVLVLVLGGQVLVLGGQVLVLGGRFLVLVLVLEGQVLVFVLVLGGQVLVNSPASTCNGRLNFVVYVFSIGLVKIDIHVRPNDE